MERNPSSRLSLKERRERYRQQLQETLTRLVEVLSADPTVQRVILFGSYARGRADLLTDLDLVVVQSSDRDFLTRMTELYGRIGPLPVDADILVYTPQEWEQMQDTPFGRRVMREGKVLYEKVSP
ncbi:MAG: nucleotidyltransferase domain-containing protein [Thermoflexales bacterium]|nr:nucleotidyltransferase domain-containing protein [Thermoflexales bacterium]